MGTQTHIAFPAPASFEERLLTREEVEEMTTLSCSEIYRRLRKGEFPAPRQLGPRAVAWYLSAVQEWIRDLPPAANVRIGDAEEAEPTPEPTKKAEVPIKPPRRR